MGGCVRASLIIQSLGSRLSQVYLQRFGFKILTGVLTAVCVHGPHWCTYSSLCSRLSQVYLQQFAFMTLPGVITAVWVHNPHRCTYSSFGSRPSQVYLQQFGFTTLTGVLPADEANEVLDLGGCYDNHIHRVGTLLRQGHGQKYVNLLCG